MTWLDFQHRGDLSSTSRMSGVQMRGRPKVSSRRREICRPPSRFVLLHVMRRFSKIATFDDVLDTLVPAVHSRSCDLSIVQVFARNIELTGQNKVSIFYGVRQLYCCSAHGKRRIRGRRYYSIWKRRRLPSPEDPRLPSPVQVQLRPSRYLPLPCGLILL